MVTKQSNTVSKQFVLLRCPCLHTLVSAEPRRGQPIWTHTAPLSRFMEAISSRIRFSACGSGTGENTGEKSVMLVSSSQNCQGGKRLLSGERCFTSSSMNNSWIFQNNHESFQPTRLLLKIPDSLLIIEKAVLWFSSAYESPVSLNFWFSIL